MAAGLVVVASAQGALPLQQRVLGPSELPGFAINGPPEIVPSAAAWYRVKLSRRFKDSAALKARGFVVGAREQLIGLNARALSVVIEFKNPRGARAMASQTIADLRSGSYALKRFAVPGIPDAQAAASSTANDKALSIAFADGRFWYLVSVRYPPKAAKPPQRTSLIAAARILYRRVHAA
jgi:hypothetical protein